MTYTIKSKRQEQDTLFTAVEFVFGEGELEVKQEVEIAHFQPQSKEEVITGIENRMASELRKLESSNVIKGIIEKL